MKFRRKEGDPRSSKIIGLFLIAEAVAVLIILLGRFVFHWF